MRLTEADALAYHQDNAGHCPYCKSDDISAGKMDSEGLTAWQDVECKACGRHWNEVFALVAIDDFAPDSDTFTTVDIPTDAPAAIC
jgi:hypothetical protein